MRFRFSIRLKIFVLLASALLVTLFSALYIATQLMIRDKTSYLYEANLMTAREVLRELEARVGSVQVGLRALAAPGATEAALAERVSRLVAEDGVKGIWIGGRAPRGFGPDARSAEGVDRRLGWDWAGERVAPLGGTQMAVGVPLGDGAGAVAVVDLALKGLKLADRLTDIRLTDSAGRILVASSNLGEAAPPEAEYGALVKDVLASSFPEGVREWSAGPSEFLAAYVSDPAHGFRALTLVPRDEAMKASRVLAQKLAIFGGSLLLTALGLSLLFSGSMTRRIRAIWLATQRVSQGDFDVRASGSKRVWLPDESADLASAFDAMAGKISELLAETAEKARMEKEIETAQLVQSRYFPQGGFSHPCFHVDGRLLAASECGGDWWNFLELGDQILLMLGDATGHGVQAALVTAAAHGAVAMLKEDLRRMPTAEAKLKLLFSRLDHVIHAAGGGQSNMTFAAAVFDLKTGMLTAANASHPPVYLLRQGGSLKPLMGARFNALGDGVGQLSEFETTQLGPGDSLVLYTDGVLEPRPDGEKHSKAQFVRVLKDTVGGENAVGSDALMRYFVEFFGEGEHARPDDITVILAQVPASAPLARIPDESEPAPSAA